MSFDTGMILDFMILLMLGVTIFYAARLSFFMKTFREGRKDLIKLMEVLSKNIEQAQNSIEGMHHAAASSGEELQAVIKEAKFLSDELQFMNQSGDALAGRLEKLAERNRELIDLMESSGGIGVSESYLKDVQEYTTPVREEIHQETFREEQPDPFFNIQDKEFNESLLEPEIETAPVSPSSFKSEAEKEFYEALQKRGQKRGRKKMRAGGVL